MEKRFNKILLGGFTVMSSVMLLTGCSGSQNSATSKLEGEWVSVTGGEDITINGNQMLVDEEDNTSYDWMIDPSSTEDKLRVSDYTKNDNGIKVKDGDLTVLPYSLTKSGKTLNIRIDGEDYQFYLKGSDDYKKAKEDLRTKEAKEAQDMKDYEKAVDDLTAKLNQEFLAAIQGTWNYTTTKSGNYGTGYNWTATINGNSISVHQEETTSSYEVVGKGEYGLDKYDYVDKTNVTFEGSATLKSDFVTPEVVKEYIADQNIDTLDKVKAVDLATYLDNGGTSYKIQVDGSKTNGEVWQQDLSIIPYPTHPDKLSIEDTEYTKMP